MNLKGKKEKNHPSVASAPTPHVGYGSTEYSSGDWASLDGLLLVTGLFRTEPCCFCANPLPSPLYIELQNFSLPPHSRHTPPKLAERFLCALYSSLLVKLRSLIPLIYYDFNEQKYGDC